jgi:CheY-like chemotaxis protein
MITTLGLVIVVLNAAYDAMYETVFDLIISDIMMPEVDGYKFARTVRSRNSDL